MIMLFKGNSSRLEHLIEKIQANKENHDVTTEDIKDALGSTAGSSWRSSTPDGGSRTPESSASERDITFTLGTTENTPYQCQFCEKAFPRLSYLKKHEQTHSDQMPFRCDFCSRLFKHKRSRDRHVKLHTGDRKYRCVHCEAAFSRSDHLKIHMKTHDNQKPFQCTVCNRGYNTAAALTSHMQNHKRSSDGTGSTANVTSNSGRGVHGYRCLQCGERFRKPEQLQSHMSAVHARESPSNSSPRTPAAPTPPSPRGRPPQSAYTPKLACIYCTRDTFTTMDQLQAHVHTMHGSILSGAELAPPAVQNGPSLSPALPYPCDFCTMRFSTTISLQGHIATAHAKLTSPLACVACSIPFSSPSQLTEHFLTVHGEQMRPTDLSKKSSKKPRLNDDHHLNSGTLLCNQCGAALPDFESFRVHLRAHLDGRSPSLSCQQCGARFSDATSLERHTASHLLAVGSEFACPSCSRAFVKPDELQKHLMDLHAHHLYRCAICKEMFDSKVAIQVHFAVKHSHECKVYQCTGCGSSATFRSETEFAAHIRLVHTPPQPPAPLPAVLPQAPIRCLFCRAVCSSELEMQFHLAAHADQFRCPICREGFHVEFLLDRHMQTHHSAPHIMNGDSPKSKQQQTGRISVKNLPTENDDTKKEINNCDICDRSDFQNESELIAHRKLAHHIKTSGGKNGVVSLHCAYCNENCKSRTELENHMKTHSQGITTGGKHKCLICDEVYPSAAILAEHKLSHCKVLSGNNCTHCKITLSSEEQFFTHLTQHSNNNNSPGSPHSGSSVSLPTSCVVCRQTIVSDLEARIHARFHLKNAGAVTESFQCDLCLKTFDQKDVIPTGGERNNGIPTTHVCKECYRQHSGTAQTLDRRCGECLIKFETVAALESHIETVHRKNYTCIECHAAFESEQEVRAHVRGHVAGSSALECKLCRRSMGSPIQLQTHLIEHTFAGCGGFTCYLCSSVFTAASSLQQHMHGHGLAARPYDCGRCGLKFFFRAELDNHSYIHLEDDMRIKMGEAENQLNKNLYYMNGYHPMEAIPYYQSISPGNRKIKTPKSPAEQQQPQKQKEGTVNDDKAVKEEVIVKQEVEEKGDEYIEVSSPITKETVTDNNQETNVEDEKMTEQKDIDVETPVSPKKEVIEKDDD